jgi:hypothetical protein
VEPTTIANLAATFQACGPWGIVVVLGWVVWRQNGSLLETVRAGTAAIERSTSALCELREAIDRWRDDDHKRR